MVGGPPPPEIEELNPYAEGCFWIAIIGIVIIALMCSLPIFRGS